MEEEIELIIDSAEEGMQNAISHLNKQLLNIRAGKASPSMLGSVMVEYYGSLTPLNQVANVNAPDARTISVQPFEKGSIPNIEKGILQANLGFNPMNNGESVIISVPPLTEERRKQLVKQESKQSAPHPTQEKRKQLVKQEGKSFEPQPTPKAKTPPSSPQKPKKRRRRAARVVERVGRGGPTTVAPVATQQVSVPVTTTSPGITGLVGKIDALLKTVAAKKTKRAKKSGFSQAKKQYKAARKKRIDQVKYENKAIRKREAAKINKMPVKSRAAARKKLTAALKARVTRVSKEMPSKVETPGQLSNLIRSIRTLRV